MALGIERDARDLAEIQIERQMQRIGDGIVGDDRYRLGEGKTRQLRERRNAAAAGQ